MSVDWIGYGYAAVIASGGVVGYAKARKCFTVRRQNVGLYKTKSFKMNRGYDDIHVLYIVLYCFTMHQAAIVI